LTFRSCERTGEKEEEKRIGKGEGKGRVVFAPASLSLFSSLHEKGKKRGKKGGGE